jgi:DNA-binding transcriptional ArsR family regulator
MDTKRLQKIAKGFANRHRIRILLLLNKTPNLSVGELSDTLKISFRMASEHTYRLQNSGLIEKSYNSNQVEHVLTPLGLKVVRILRRL